MKTRIVLHVAMSSVAGSDNDDVVDAPDGWDRMTEAQQQEWAQGYLQGHIDNAIEASWWVADEGE